MTAPILTEEKCKVKLEVEEKENGTWEVREIRVYTYKTPLAARNKMEEYIYRNKCQKGNEVW